MSDQVLEAPLYISLYGKKVLMLPQFFEIDIQETILLSRQEESVFKQLLG